ncbi:hypothetical protein AWB73_00115 [Caballeronia turbans]|nr:hypothetical protein AWB73_00115 [Caballeronia turbans]
MTKQVQLTQVQCDWAVAEAISVAGKVAEVGGDAVSAAVAVVEAAKAAAAALWQGGDGRDAGQ